MQGNHANRENTETIFHACLSSCVIRDYCSHLLGWALLVESQQLACALQIIVLIKAAAARIAWHHFKRIWNNVPIQQFWKTRGERERENVRADCVEAFWEVGHSIAFSVTWHESNASSMEIQAVPQWLKCYCVPDKGHGFIAPPCLHAWPALSNKAFRSKSQAPLSTEGSRQLC